MILTGVWLFLAYSGMGMKVILYEDGGTHYWDCQLTGQGSYDEQYLFFYLPVVVSRISFPKVLVSRWTPLFTGNMAEPFKCL